MFFSFEASPWQLAVIHGIRHRPLAAATCILAAVVGWDHGWVFYPLLLTVIVTFYILSPSWKFRAGAGLGVSNRRVPHVSAVGDMGERESAALCQDTASHAAE